jgi:hypothetical protein
MSTTFNFSDRFSYPSPDGVSPTINYTSAQSLTDPQLEAASAELKDMAAMVRRYSVLLRQTRTLDIFNLITTDADPRIALILSAAKAREDNAPLFGGAGAVKEVMYADPDRPGQTKYVNRDLFSDGIRRVSAAFTAARLVGQLAQIPEQAEHAKVIEQEAEDDLNRIIATWDLSQVALKGDKAKEESEIPVGFFFQPLTVELPEDKQVEVYWQSPSLSRDWTLLNIYTGTFQTWDVVVALSEDINAKTIPIDGDSILTAPELAGPYFTNPIIPNSFQYHALRFYPRRPMPGTFAYSINIQIRTTFIDPDTTFDTTAEEFPIDKAPIVWGVEGDNLNYWPVNGAIVIIRYNKLLDVRSKAEDYEPTVLYFRNRYRYGEENSPASPSGLTTNHISFRLQAWQPNQAIDEETLEPIAEFKVEVPYKVGATPEEQIYLDNNRFSQVTLALHNALADINLDARAMGAIIRNDPITASNPCSALELVAWAKSRVITAVVLDILEVPEDIEVATGDRTRPITMFSSKPRSIIVKNPNSDGASGVVDAVMKKEQAFVKQRQKPSLWSNIVDEAQIAEQRGWSY